MVDDQPPKFRLSTNGTEEILLLAQIIVLIERKAVVLFQIAAFSIMTNCLIGCVLRSFFFLPSFGVLKQPEAFAAALSMDRALRDVSMLAGAPVKKTR